MVVVPQQTNKECVLDKPNLTIEELVEQAEEILARQDFFILAYDIVDSKKLGDRRQEVLNCQTLFHSWVNRTFPNKIPFFEWSILEDRQGMHMLRGDSGLAAFSDSGVIEKIVREAEQLFNMELRWATGESIYDDCIKNIF